MPTQRFSCADCAKWFEFDSTDDESVADTIACPFCHQPQAERVLGAAGAMTGTYKYSRALGRMIKVSDVTPRLGGGGGCAGCSSGSCGSCGGH